MLDVTGPTEAIATVSEVKDDEQINALVGAGTITLMVDGVSLTATQSAAFLQPCSNILGSRSAFFESVPPTLSDDETAGYSVGSRWIDRSTNRSYICTDATAGAAVWREAGTVSDSYGVYDSTGGQTFTGSPVTVNLDAQYATPSATYSLVNSEVTVNETSRYWVSYTITIESSAGGRTNAQAWLELNGSPIAGTRVSLYCRQVNHGASGGHSFPINLISGDVLRIRVVRSIGIGTLAMELNGSNLSLMRIE